MSLVHQPTVACRPVPPIDVEVEKTSSDASIELLPVLGGEKNTDVSPIVVVTEALSAEGLPSSEIHHEASPADCACPVKEEAPPLGKESTSQVPSKSTAHMLGVAVPDSVQLPKPSAWTRFWEGLAHDPLNEPEFVEAYNDWKKRNRKERYERRRAWVRAHGTKLGRILRLVNKKQSAEAWAVYREKLAYMED